jgi:hypothetical protein
LYKAIQVQNASISNFDNSDNSIVGSNVFYGGSPNDFRYISTGTSTIYRLNNSVHSWFIAPLGTAGDAISFTQAMTLGSNSGLSIGTPSAAPSQGLLVQGDTTLSSSLAVNGNKITLGSQEDIVSTNGILLGSGVSTIEMVASNFAAGYGAKIEQADPGDGFTYTRLFGRANSTSWTQNFQVNNSTGAATFSSSVSSTEFRLNNVSTLQHINVYTVLKDLVGRNAILLGDTNDPVNYYDNSQHFFRSRTGSNRVVINDSGNVGIGTPSPNGKLDVRTAGQAGVPALGTAGNGINITRTDGQTGGSIGYTTEGHIYIQSQRFDSVNANNLFLQPVGGNVGIGTTSPTERLHVETSNEYQITWARTGAGKRWAIGTDTAGFYFNNRTDSVLPLYITNGGNVLIGTTTDNGSRLRVNGSVALPHVTKSANYTLDNTDYTVGFDCASNRTATLPDATTCAGRIYVIYHYNTGMLGSRYVTIDPNGSQTINGLTTFSLQYTYDFSSVMIQSNGSNWIIISDSIYYAPV